MTYEENTGDLSAFFQRDDVIGFDPAAAAAPEQAAPVIASLDLTKTGAAGISAYFLL
jgi:hypothetical protein